MSQPIAIAIHGGAGNIRMDKMPADKQQSYQKGLENAIKVSYDRLAGNGSAMDAVETAVTRMEDYPLFNAGRGSVVDHRGKIEMEAAIMDGANLEAGAAVGLERTRNPVALARAIRHHSQHIMLNGEGAENFAREHSIPQEDEQYFITDHRYDQWVQLDEQGAVSLDHNAPQGGEEIGTVGAVALDGNGHLAAATSTGGMVNKKYNRIGDTPLIGAGTYADNRWGAVSTTGHGEYFMRLVAAYSVISMREFGGMELTRATQLLIHHKLDKLGGQGGLIAIDPSGRICMPFNAPGMFRASMRNDAQEPLIAMFDEQTND
ncbi:MAG: beta-aspartyl-peptidase [Bacteroidetes bacterium SW_11_45_7]|nr:MAG: beta-aspartyl-peptidase [Bacteroidetes bacterium SW_11_45_7]